MAFFLGSHPQQQCSFCRRDFILWLSFVIQSWFTKATNFEKPNLNATQEDNVEEVVVVEAQVICDFFISINFVFCS